MTRTLTASQSGLNLTLFFFFFFFFFCNFSEKKIFCCPTSCLPSTHRNQFHFCVLLQNLVHSRLRFFGTENSFLDCSTGSHLLFQSVKMHQQNFLIETCKLYLLKVVCFRMIFVWSRNCSRTALLSAKISQYIFLSFSLVPFSLLFRS